MEKILDKQDINKPERDERGRLLPGNTANLAGRPKGKTLKEWVRERLSNMDEEQRLDFLKDIPKDLQWRMSEGNPATETEHKGELKVQIIPSEIIEKNDIQIPSSTKPNSEGQDTIQSSVLREEIREDNSGDLRDVGESSSETRP